MAEREPFRFTEEGESTFKEIKKIDIDTLSIHEEAHKTFRMTEENFNALVSSIEEKGQEVEVIVWRGKIIDGRHRYWALKKLNAKTIKAEVCPYNWTLEQVISKIESLEMRRHMTSTQSAIYAWMKLKEYASNGKTITQLEASIKFAAPIAQLKRVEAISKLRSDVDSDSNPIRILSSGKKINVSRVQNKPKFTDSLSVVLAWLKESSYIESGGNDGVIIEDRELSEPEMKRMNDILRYVKKESDLFIDEMSKRLYMIKLGTETEDIE